MRHRIAILLFALAACSKSEAPSPAPAESASAPQQASAPPSAEPAPKAAAPAASPSLAASAAASASPPAECGTKPLPDCPLQAWMKSNLNPPVMSKDAPALATALDKTAGFAPAGYANWASISKDGAAAARSGDLDAAKAACRTCHDQYKQKYKTELRARKL